MEHNEYLRRLSELCKYEVLTPKTSPDFRSNFEQVLDVKLKEGDSFQVSMQENVTLGVKLKRVIHKPRKCEHCDDHVMVQVIDIKKNAYPTPVWREHCSVCSMYRNPETGEFDIAHKSAQTAFKAYYNKVKDK